MTNNLINLLEEKTSFSKGVIQNILKLLDDGCTIPFIARYRKDLTSNATDEQLRDFEEIYNYSLKLLNRKEEIINILKERNFLDEKLLAHINSATTLQMLEDIYAPFKDKKSSRTLSALENGLLEFIPKSHKIEFSKDRFDEVDNFLDSHPKNIELIKTKVHTNLQKGDVVLFHCKTLHHANKNSSDKPKISFVYTVRANSNKPITNTRSNFKEVILD